MRQQYRWLLSSMANQLTFIQQKKANRTHTNSSCTKLKLLRNASHYTKEGGIWEGRTTCAVNLGFERSFDVWNDVIRSCGWGVAFDGNAIFSDQKLGVVPCDDSR
jgi:hypothetical protein